mmetsp:Transcript_7628/g.17561  ORF Transcript_7628/g.17561 Transcript_7628/m.17561 type:complete len:215 (+) Transcript_7628:1718-2362(+)
MPSGSLATAVAVSSSSCDLRVAAWALDACVIRCRASTASAYKGSASPTELSEDSVSCFPSDASWSASFCRCASCSAAWAASRALASATRIASRRAFSSAAASSSTREISPACSSAARITDCKDSRAAKAACSMASSSAFCSFIFSRDSSMSVRRSSGISLSSAGLSDSWIKLATLAMNSISSGRIPTTGSVPTVSMMKAPHARLPPGSRIGTAA